MKELTRRMMLQYGAAAMTMPLIGCEKPADSVDNIVNDMANNIVTADNLYFSNRNPYLTKPRLEQILHETTSAFDTTGIKFKKVQEVKSFPELSGLDILMIYPEMHANAPTGKFGLGTYERMLFKEQLPSFPYNKRESEVHICYANINGLMSKAATEDKRIKSIVAVSIHEIAHGLGAPHIEPAKGCTGEVCEPKQFYMYQGNHYNPSTFHYINIKKMKAFIQKVQAISKDITKEDKGKIIVDLRMRSIGIVNYTHYAPFSEW